MVGSWIGRALIGLPAVLGAVGAGTVVVGWIGEIAPGIAVTVLLAGIAILRASRTGIVVDVHHGVLVVQGFWRDRRIAADELRCIDLSGSPETGAPGIQFVTVDGQEVASLALAYLADDRADRVVALVTAAAGRPVDVMVDRRGLRPSTG